MQKSGKSLAGALATLTSAVATVIGVWFYQDQTAFAKRVGGNPLASNLSWLGVGMALLGCAGALLGVRAWGVFDDPMPVQTGTPQRSIALSIATPTTPYHLFPDGRPGYSSTVGLQNDGGRPVWTTPVCETQQESYELALDWRTRYERGEIPNRSELADL